MNYLLYILSALGIIFLIVLFWFWNIVRKVKNELKNKPRDFKDPIELIKFIRNIFECKFQHNVVMYGFVKSVNRDDILVSHGLADEPCLDLTIGVITQKGYSEVDATCGNINANLNKGDFVAVLPIYNERHNLWYYITIAKLKAVYLGEKGFLVDEQYID